MFRLSNRPLRGLGAGVRSATLALRYAQTSLSAGGCRSHASVRTSCASLRSTHQVLPFAAPANSPALRSTSHPPQSLAAVVSHLYIHICTAIHICIGTVVSCVRLYRYSCIVRVRLYREYVAYVCKNLYEDGVFTTV